MKQYIPLFFLLLCFRTIGQIVTITPVQPNPLPEKICPGTSAKFKVSVQDTGAVDTGFYSYQWRKGGFNILNDTNETLIIATVTTADSGVYQCLAVRNDTTYFSNELHVKTYLPLVIDTLYRYDELHCPGCEHSVTYLCSVSGGDEVYNFNWGQGSRVDSAGNNLYVGLFCTGDAVLTIKDTSATHCIYRKYTVEALTLPKMKITKDPRDTVFLTNPTLTVSFPDTARQHLSYWAWTFVNDTANAHQDSTVVEMLNPATHDYTVTGTFPVKLFFTDINGCDSTVIDTILVKQIDLKIPSVFTPNSDGFNDAFYLYDGNNKNDKLDLKKVYLSNRLVVFDRWGAKVLDRDNYENGTWDGGNLSTGAYFCIFKGHGKYEDDTVKGTVTILR